MGIDDSLCASHVLREPFVHGVQISPVNRATAVAHDVVDVIEHLNRKFRLPALLQGVVNDRSTFFYRDKPIVGSEQK